VIVGTAFLVDILDESIANFGTPCLFIGCTRHALKPQLPVLTLDALRHVSGFQILVLLCPFLNVFSSYIENRPEKPEELSVK
jgi:hypothetical protein